MARKQRTNGKMCRKRGKLQPCGCSGSGCYWRRLTHSPVTVGDSTTGYRALYLKPAADTEISWCVCAGEIDITPAVMIGDLSPLFTGEIPFDSLSEPDSVVIWADGETPEGVGVVRVKAIKDGVEYPGYLSRVNDYRQRDSFENCAPCMGAGTQVRVGFYDGFVTSGTIRTQIQVTGSTDVVNPWQFGYFPKIYACTDTAIRVKITPRCQWSGDSYGAGVVFVTAPTHLDFYINDEFAYRETFNSPTLEYYDFELAAGDSLFVVQTNQANSYPNYAMEPWARIPIGVPFPYAATIWETYPEINYPVFQPNNKNGVTDPAGRYTYRTLSEAEELATVSIPAGSTTIDVPVGLYAAIFGPSWDFYSGEGDRYATFLARWQEFGMWAYGVYDRDAPFNFISMGYKFALHPADGEWVDVPPAASVVCSGTPTHTRLYKMAACDPENTMPAFIYEEDRNAIPTLDSTELSGFCYVATPTLVDVADLPADYYLAGTLTSVGCVGCEGTSSSSGESSDPSSSSGGSSSDDSSDSSDSSGGSDSDPGSGSSGGGGPGSSDPGSSVDGSSSDDSSDSTPGSGSGGSGGGSSAEEWMPEPPTVPDPMPCSTPIQCGARQYSNPLQIQYDVQFGPEFAGMFPSAAAVRNTYMNLGARDAVLAQAFKHTNVGTAAVTVTKFCNAPGNWKLDVTIDAHTFTVDVPEFSGQSAQVIVPVTIGSVEGHVAVSIVLLEPCTNYDCSFLLNLPLGQSRNVTDCVVQLCFGVTIGGESGEFTYDGKCYHFTLHSAGGTGPSVDNPCSIYTVERIPC